MKLTAKATAALVLPTDKNDHIEWDEDLKRFGYRLRKIGDKVARSWVVQYRHAGNTRRMTLNSILSAGEARAEAEKILAKVALDQDPQSERKRRASADRFTFAALAEQYLAAKKPDVRGRSFTEMQRYLQSFYFKPLHNIPVDSVTRRDVAARVLIIGRESGQVAAARARTALSGMFSWAMAHGLCEANPTVGTAKPKEPPSRERTLSDQELLAVWRAAGDDDFGRIVKLLALTGQRRTEVGGMCWSEIDLGGSTWVIPKERAKNKRQHKVPLAKLALNVIRAVPTVVGRDLLFGARTDRGFTSWNEHKRKLEARLGGQVRPWTLHDLRRTFCTRLADLGVLPHVIEVAVNHQSGHKRGPAGIYNRSLYEREVKAAVAMWDRHVTALIEGREERNVVPIRSAGGASL
jgi:integrase